MAAAEILRRMAVKYESQLSEGKSLIEVVEGSDRDILLAAIGGIEI